MNNAFLLLQLARIDGVGPRTVLSLFASVANVSKEHLIQSILSIEVDFTVLYQYKLHDFLRHGVSQKISCKLVEGLASQHESEKELAEMHKYDIRWVSFCDEE